MDGPRGGVRGGGGAARQRAPRCGCPRRPRHRRAPGTAPKPNPPPKNQSRAQTQADGARAGQGGVFSRRGTRQTKAGGATAKMAQVALVHFPAAAVGAAAPGELVSTTGAGDCFAAGFVHAASRGQDPRPRRQLRPGRCRPRAPLRRARACQPRPPLRRGRGRRGAARRARA